MLFRSVIGNSDSDGWNNRFLIDSFGSFIRKHNKVKEEMEDINDDGESNQIIVTRYNYDFVLNPNYDDNQTYIQRSDRPEWDAVGMLGQLSVRDNGECQVNGYCKVADGGIAVPADKSDVLKYRVIKRLETNIIKIIFR